MGTKINGEMADIAGHQKDMELSTLKKDKKYKNKLIKCTTLILMLAIFIFCSSAKTFAQEITPTVRVAISDNGFKSLIYNQIAITSTTEYCVYDKATKKQIVKLLPTDILKIKSNIYTLDLTVNNKLITKNPGAIIIDSPKGLLGVENLKRNGKTALYRGNFEIIPKNATSFYLVNVLDLQNYLKGVVPNEMPVRFGVEALKAQTIAARNYVLMPRTRYYKEFDVDDSVSSQVYFGASTESEISNRAVNETEGLVALYNWDLILAQYSSTAGGYTENYENAFSDPKTKEFPAKPKAYLQGRPDIINITPLNREEEARIFYMTCPDSYDIKSPYYRWKKEWDANELQEVLKKTLIDQSNTGFVKPQFKKGEGLGELKELKVKRRGVSGKVMELEVVTDKETYHVEKEIVVRRLLQKKGVSLPSANVVFENIYDTDKKLNKVIAYGGGFGHGVGMSQFGAGFMSTSLHKSFDKILKRYYSGISISTIPVIISSTAEQKNFTQQFYAPYAKANLIIDNKYNISGFNANINGRTVSFELSNKIVPFHRVSKIDISSYIKQGKNNVTYYFPDKNERKAIRLYVELVEKDNDGYEF